MNKSEIRSLAKQLRKALSAGRRAKAENVITQELLKDVRVALQKHDASRPFTIALYSAFGSELSLHKFIAAVRLEFPNINICFPAMVRGTAINAQNFEFSNGGTDTLAVEEAQTLHMEFRIVPDIDIVSSSEVPKFLVNQIYTYVQDDLELAKFAKVTPKDIDYMVVPMLAFDDAGTRLGYGGGNYDRYLPMLQADSKVVGAAFAVQKVGEIPKEPHDVVIDRIIYA